MRRLHLWAPRLGYWLMGKQLGGGRWFRLGQDLSYWGTYHLSARVLLCGRRGHRVGRRDGMLSCWCGHTVADDLGPPGHKRLIHNASFEQSTEGWQ